MKETIDKRTWQGRQLITTLNEATPAKMQQTADKMGIHPALTLLRVKDILAFRLELNMN